MTRLTLPLLLAATAIFAEYKVEPAGPPPPEIAAAILAELQPAGQRILGADGKPYCELWFRKQAPKGPESSETDVMWKTVPPGSVIGAIRYPAQGTDRRGTTIQPGVYLLRFSMHPINGDHQGVAPNRDFLVMTRPADDTKPDPISDFDELVAMSTKVSQREHPAVLSMMLVENNFTPGLKQAGEDWSLHFKLGEAQIGLIVIGVTEH
jgi:hypothetical protein